LTIDGTLNEAAAMLRELGVYAAEDVAAARRRSRDEGRPRHYRMEQDATAEQLLRRQEYIGHLADQVAALDPSTVAAAPPAIDHIRSLARYLVLQLGLIDADPVVRRAFTKAHPSRPRLRVVAYRVVAYLRVSTDRQADDGMGLDVQEAAIRDWARRSKARIAYTVRDQGKSGAADVVDRPGLAEALGHVQGGRADAIVVARADRLARDLVLQEWLRAEVLRAGAELRSASPVEDLYMRDDPTDPTGNLVRQILGAVSEYERAMVRLRMEAGKAMKRKAGGYAGGAPPYGYRAADHDLVPNLDEQRNMQRMRRWRREGKSLRDIANRLNDSGIPARRGRWHPTTVARVVDRVS
jgi:DNA invertase Pin-like site-specific DNA recombinase